MRPARNAENQANNQATGHQGEQELQDLVSQYTAPMPNQTTILTDYEVKDRLKKNKERAKRGHNVELAPE